jgi:hypothetical protein
MTVATELTVRVWVTEVWDSVALSVTADWTVARLKEAALAAATGRDTGLTAYRVKFRGALVLDEGETLAALGTPDRAAFVVLPSHRQPVR